jgi:hypothetical protein
LAFSTKAKINVTHFKGNLTEKTWLLISIPVNLMGSQYSSGKAFPSTKLFPPTNPLSILVEPDAGGSHL